MQHYNHPHWSNLDAGDYTLRQLTSNNIQRLERNKSYSRTVLGGWWGANANPKTKSLYTRLVAKVQRRSRDTDRRLSHGPSARLRDYTAACESDSESDGLQDFVVGDGDEESSSVSGSSSEPEDARTLFARQQNAELIVPADESAFFDTMHDEME